MPKACHEGQRRANGCQGGPRRAKAPKVYVYTSIPRTGVLINVSYVLRDKDIRRNDKIKGYVCLIKR